MSALDFKVADPNGTNYPNQSAGGASKVRSSADAPHPTEQVGYGYMSSDLKNVEAPNGVSLPVAQPISIEVSGDPNNTGA